MIDCFSFVFTTIVLHTHTDTYIEIYIYIDILVFIYLFIPLKYFRPFCSPHVALNQIIFLRMRSLVYEIVKNPPF